MEGAEVWESGLCVCECVSVQDSGENLRDGGSDCERRLWDVSDFNDVYDAAVALFFKTLPCALVLGGYCLQER